MSVPSHDASNRLAWVDYAKAIAIVLVVFGHASRSVQRTDGLSWGGGLQLADQLIYSFHIPLFFILAGFTASRVAGRGIGPQVRGLFWGVAVPYLVWSYAWVGLKIVFPGSVNEPAEWTDLITGLWRPVEHMWFLQHLLIARLFWMAAERMNVGTPDGAMGHALVLLLFAFASWTATFETEPQYLTAIMSNIAFVGVGFLWVPALVKRSNLVSRFAFACVAFLGWLLIALHLSADALGPMSFTAALFGSLMVLMAVWQMPPPAGRVARAVAFLGEASLAIYVVHSIVIAALRTVLQRAGALDETLFIVLGTCVGLTVPALLYLMTLEFSARTGRPLTRFAGFGTGTRSHYLTTTRPSAVAEPAAVR